MTTKNTILIFLSLLALGTAGVIAAKNLFGGPPHDDSMQRVTYWMCRNDGCAVEFTVSMGDIVRARKTDDGYVTCPHCKSAKCSEGYQCPSCQRVLELIGHGRLPNDCPHCDHHFGNWVDPSRFASEDWANHGHSHVEGTAYHNHPEDAAPADDAHAGDGGDGG